MVNIKETTYEQFLLSKDKKGFVDGLMKGSQQHEFFSLLLSLRQPASESVVQEQERLLATLKTSFKEKKDLENIVLLNRLALEEDPKKVKELLAKFNNTNMNYYFSRGAVEVEEEGKPCLQDKPILPSVLSQSEKDRMCMLSLENMSTKDFGILTEEAIACLDTAQVVQHALRSDQQRLVSMFLRRKQRLFQVQGLPALAAQVYDQFYKNTDLSAFVTDMNMQAWSVAQLEQVQTLVAPLQGCSQFVVDILMRKKFTFKEENGEESGEETEEDLRQQRDNLRQMVAYLQNIPNKVFLSFIALLKKKMMSLTHRLKEFDFELFFDLLESKMEEMKKKDDLVTSMEYPRKKEFHAHIKQIMREGKHTSKLALYFDKDQLKKVSTRVRLLQGEKVDDAEAVLGKTLLEKLVQKKKLKIQERKGKLGADDKVSVWVKVKNIKTVEVKVFQLNCEEYYLKKNCQIDGSLNLDGLAPNHTQSLDFPHHPSHQHLHQFTLAAPCLESPGVFLVEVQGGGVSSRTLFQKGCLFMVPKTSVVGHQVQLYDQSGPIESHGSRLGLYLDKEFVAADSHGLVKLPFQQSCTSKQVVLVHDKLASLCSLQLEKEDYEFKAQFIYNSEALLENNVAEFLVKPSLFLKTSQEMIPASFQMATKMDVHIQQEDECGIMTKKKVEVTRDTLIQSQKEGNDILVSAQIVKRVKNIQLRATCEVKPISRDTETQMDQHKVSINNQTGCHTFCTQFLQLTKSGAKVLLLGKTGEPKVGVTLSVMLVSRFHNDPRDEEYSTELMTDQDGAVHLGSMEGVRHVYSVVKEGKVKADTRKWTLLPERPHFDYQNNLVLLENETITMPFQGESVALYHHNQGFFIKDCSCMCTVKQDQFVIQGLPHGDYTLNIGDKSMELNVMKGKYVEDNKVVLHKDKLVRLPRNNQAYKTLKSVRLCQDGHRLTLETNRPGVTVHLLGYSFLDKEMDTLLNSFSKDYYNQIHYNLPSQPNQTFNGKRLSDELVYVLDRRDQPRYVGNYLSKPQVLLNRQFNEDTNVDQEILRDQNDYLQSQCRNMMEKNRMCKKSRGDAGGRFGMMANRFKNVPGMGQQDSLRFLASRAATVSSVRSDQEGKAVVDEVWVEKQQYVVALVQDRNQVWVSQVALEDKPIEKSQLGQKQGQAGSYVSSRLTAGLAQGESLVFQDIQGTEFQLLDSLAELSQVHSLLRGCPQEKDWDFLLRWQALPLEQKHKHYSDKASHELHLFLFFKDRPYFDLFVKPFLANKFSKTFMDYWLLQDVDRLQPYVLRPALLQTLHQHEVLLLLHFVVHHQSLVPYASSLAAFVKANARPTDRTVFNRLFDQVMKSKVNEIAPKKINTASVPGQHIQQKRALFGAPAMNQCFAVQRMCPQSRRIGGGMELSQESVDREMEEEQMDYEEYLDQDIEEFRSNYRPGRKEVDSTKEYVERNYLLEQGRWEHDQQFSEFLVAYSEHLLLKPDSPFLSAHCVASYQNMGQRILAMALSDLPFTSLTPLLEQEDRKMTLTSQSHLLVFYKQFQLGTTQLKAEILVSQRFFDPLDQFREEDGLRVEKEVEEYVVDRVYGCQVAVTNCSVAEHLLQVILQLPHQALPVSSLLYTQQVNQLFPSFTTKTFSFFFYFPTHGEFHLQPASVNRQGTTVGVASPQSFLVKQDYSKVDTSTLTHVLSQGTPAQVLAFLKDANLHDQDKFSPNSIEHLLVQPGFFREVVQIMQQQHFFCPDVLAYSILHGDKALFYEIVAKQVEDNHLFREVPFYHHPAFLVDHFCLKEYFPIINNRAHQLRSADQTILNVQLRNQYFSFVKYLCYKANVSADDHIILAYYLLLQERVQESIETFQAVPKNQVTCQLQYDYLQAYLDFYIGAPDFTYARALSSAHLNHPVLHWRKMFQEIALLLAEYDGEQVSEEQTGQKPAREEEEQVSLKLEGEQIIIKHSCTQRLQLFFYKVDLEVLFSINPFILSENSEQENFMLMLPNHQVSLECNPQGLISLQMPEQFRQQNLQLLVKGQRKMASATYFPNQMEVVVQNTLGQLRVLHATHRTPLPKVYIKTYVKTKRGNAQFYKDGYTDLVGRFDYSQCTSDQVQLSDIDQYYILVASDQHGCALKQANPTNSTALFQTPQLSSKVQGLFDQGRLTQQSKYDARHS